MFKLKYHKNSILFRLFALFIVFSFALSLIAPIEGAYAQSSASLYGSVLNLPAVGSMIRTTDSFVPPFVKGITIYPENPFRFDFIVDSGNSGLKGDELTIESKKLIKYFLASLTIPEEELWVNLSPYEEGRIISTELGMTGMGRDLLVQDYILKQLTASLIYPKDDLGRKFWDKVYKKAYELYGTTDFPMNTFNKVWIIPDKAVVYEHNHTAIVTDSHLKVMLAEDYLAMKAGIENVGDVDLRLLQVDKNKNNIELDLLRELIIPIIEKEVNEGKNFAALRQMFNSMILATWYKQLLKSVSESHMSPLHTYYVDQKKVNGVEIKDKNIVQKIIFALQLAHLIFLNHLCPKVQDQHYVLEKDSSLQLVSSRHQNHHFLSLHLKHY